MTRGPQPGRDDLQHLQGDGARNVLPPFIVRNGPVLEARFKRKPDGSPDGSVHPLFVISGRVKRSIRSEVVVPMHTGS